MNSGLIQLLVLAGIAVFLIMRLRSVLGTREGFEKPPVPIDQAESRAEQKPEFEVIEGGAEDEVGDYVDTDSETATALRMMKKVEPSFHVGDFLDGAKGAYEMILMAFERGDLQSIEPFLADEVMESFVEVVAAREDQGLSIDATFVGIREMAIQNARFNTTDGDAEISVKFVGELTSVVKNAEGEIVEGDAKTVKRQKDVWTFARGMGSDNPNWRLVATGG